MIKTHYQIIPFDYNVTLWLSCSLPTLGERRAKFSSELTIPNR